MEGLMRKKKTAPSSVSMHKNSQSSISKMNKSKIRIIHIFAPEIIKTDAANFRELVQRLTGKPATTTEYCSKRERRMVQREKVPRLHAAAEEEGFRERVKEEEEGIEIWRDANSGGGFNSEFDHFPFLEGTTRDQMDHHACL